MAYIKQINVGGTAYDIKAAADASGNIIVDTYVNKTGDIMTGDLILDANNQQSPGIDLRSTNHLIDFIIYGNGTKGFYARASTDTNRRWMLGMNDTNIGIYTEFHAESPGYYIRDIGYGTVKPNDSEGNDGDVFITYF